MQGDDIREQIESLRREVRGLSTSILNLRQDDMRKVFGDQIKPVLIERTVRHFSHVHKGPAQVVEESLSEEGLLDLIERSVTIFQQDGKQKALGFVDEFERNMVSKTQTDRDPKKGYEHELIAQIRDYFELSDTIFNRTVSDSPNLVPVVAEPAKAILSPESVERLLAPLSNARRVQIVQVLSRESNSLAGLCKELGLQKGHLQFHLKSLLDADYIHFDRKSRLYSVTYRGTLVFDSVAKLVDNLEKNVIT